MKYRIVKRGSDRPFIPQVRIFWFWFDIYAYGYWTLEDAKNSIDAETGEEVVWQE